MSYLLSPEQAALSQERKRQKAERRAQQQAEAKQLLAERSRILYRPWISLGESSGVVGQRVKIKTWNILAQTLVRRELFPASDCLKTNQREPMIHAELLTPRADIICLQEVDRLPSLTQFLESSGYHHLFASGPRKKHGCLIAFCFSKYRIERNKVVHYDEEEVRPNGSDPRRGGSFRTKNIAQLVALRKIDNENHGLIVATTHLFWHPSYTYERARQVVILKHEVLRFRSEIGQNWPCLICGDFNFAPDDPAYSLIVGDPILPQQEDRLANSRVVHRTIDPSVPLDNAAPAEEDEGAATATGSAAEGHGTDEHTDEQTEEKKESDPDRIITNARAARPEDGLLSTMELVELASSGPYVISAYDQAQQRQSLHDESSVHACGQRYNIESHRHGAFEPMWTSYTHYWKTVLDYITIIDGDQSSQVVGYLQPPPTDDLDPGLPKSKVCGSDHISLMAEIVWNS